MGSTPDTTALEAIDDWDVTNVAAVAFGFDGILATRGDTTRTFHLASVSKVLASIATMIAVEEGTVGLDDAVGAAGSTLRHLLSHASGLGPEVGDSALAAPGRRRIYSNQAFELLAEYVADRAGMSFEQYATTALVETLGLTATDLRGSPAHGYASSAADLVAVVSAVVRGRLLAPETVATMTSPCFPTLAGVLPGYGSQDPNPWGLGVEIRGEKEPHWTSRSNSPATWGHFGRAGTFVWFDPERQIGLVVLTDREFGPWAVEAWPLLADTVLSAFG